MPPDPPLSIPGWVSYELHGHWVRLKTEDRVGRIGYHDHSKTVATVMWELPPRDPFESLDPMRVEDHLYPMDDLEPVGWEPEPWYDFEAINRRRLR